MLEALDPYSSVTRGQRRKGWYANYPSGKGFVIYDTFPILKSSLVASARRISFILAMREIDRQFVGTLVDTESATGCIPKLHRCSQRRVWIAYFAAKMKYRGDLAHLTELMGTMPPSKTLNMNTITKQRDYRWSKQFQGVVAYTLLREVRPSLYNEKSMVETDCILKHGPTVTTEMEHPFIACGARWVRRGVWFRPQIDGENNGTPNSRADK